MINRAMETVLGSDWTEQRDRMLRLERLYVLDGRHHKTHKLNGSYANLLERADELEADD